MTSDSDHLRYVGLICHFLLCHFSVKTVTLEPSKPMLKHRGKTSTVAKYIVKVCRTRLDPVEMVSILTAIHGNRPTDFPGVEETYGPC